MKKISFNLKNLFNLIAVLLCFTEFVNGQVRWTENGVAVSTATNSQEYAQIVSDGAGGAIITWQDIRGGSYYDIYAQRIDANGTALWITDGVAVCTANYDQSNHQIATDGAGGAIITWKDYRNNSNYDIYAQRVDANGNVIWTTNGVAVCTANSDKGRPQISAAGAGGAIITWDDKRSGSYYDIYAQRLDANGNAQWTTNGVAVCTATNSQLNPQISADGAGGVIITWYDYRNNAYRDIYAQRVNANGTALWTTNGVAVCTASNYQNDPQISADGGGGAIITWEDGRGSDYDIYAQRVAANGTALWAANGVVVCKATNSQYSPQISADGAGGAIITWDDKRSGSYYDIYAQRLEANGNAQWATNGVAVCTSTYDQSSPQISTDGAGGAIITWKDYRNNSNYDIYAQRVDANGTALWNANGVGLCTATDNQEYPQISANGTGGAIITWQDKRDGTSHDIYAGETNYSVNLISPDGAENWAGGTIQEIKWITDSANAAYLIDLFYSIDGGATYPNTIVTDSENDGLYQWSVPALSTSTVKIKIIAKVINGAFKGADQSEANFTIDSTPPNAFDLQSPANGAWGSGTPAFTWKASGDALSGLLKYQLFIDGVVNRDSIPASSTSCQPAGSLSDGFHTWYIKALDKVRNERNSNQTWTVKVDSKMPAAFDLYTPADSVWTNNTSPTFTWQASSDAGSGLNKYQLFIDNKLNRDNISPSVTSTTPTSALSSADHTWYIVAVDNVNNSQQSNETRLIRIDNVPPVSFNLSSPTNNSWTGDTTPTFIWQASSDNRSGLLKYQLWIDGSIKVDSIPANQTSITFDSSKALANGNHTWYVKAYDNVLNVRQSTSTWTINIDVIPPADFSLLSPQDSGFANIPTPDFTWQAATDAGAGISYYQLWIDGLLNVNNITTTTSSPATPLAEGPHSWFVNAVDKVGNIKKSKETWIVFCEWNPPLPFDLAAPPDKTTVNVSSPVFKWHPSSDVGSGILKYQLWIGGLLNKDDIPAADTTATPKDPLPNGAHNWFVKAFDRALSSTSSTSTWQVTVDKDITPPVSQITDPIANQTIGGTSYWIKGSSQDGIGSGVKVVHVSLDGGATWNQTQATTSNYSEWKWEWINYQQGSYTIKSRATDVEGNFETPAQGVTVNINVTKPNVKAVNVTPNPTSSGTIQVEIEFTVNNSGLDYSAVPAVTFTPQGGSAIPIVQTNYSGVIWRGQATIAASEKNGTAIIAVSGAKDKIGNVMDANSNAGSFVIDTRSPQSFDLIAPVDNGWVNTARPTFTWGTANDTLSGIGKYQLWIDDILNRDNILATSSSTTPTQDLQLGAHTWYIKAIDKANNSRKSASTWRFNMDFQNPACQITAPVNGDTLGGTSYSIRGTSSDGSGQQISGVFKVEISINNGQWQTAVNTGIDFSSWSFEWTGYADGNYSIKSRATDRAGNIGNSTTITVHVNKAAPKVKDITVTPNPAKVGTIEIQVAFDVNSGGMNNSVNPIVSFKPYGSSVKLIVIQNSYAGSSWTGTYNISDPIGNGIASIQVSGAKDNYGNVMAPDDSADSFVIDTYAPVVKNVKVTPNPAKAGNVNIEVKFTETTSGLNTLVSPTVTYTPKIGSSVQFTQTGYDAKTTLWTGSAIIQPLIHDGIATIQVKGATDLAGNIMADTSKAGMFLIDVTPPLSFDLIAPQDSQWVADSKPLFKWNLSADTTSGLMNYQLYINDNINVDSIPSIKDSQKSAADLTDGAYLWHIVAQDSAFNATRSLSKRLLWVDKTPPESKITYFNSGNISVGDTIQIKGVASDGKGTGVGCGVDSVFISFDGGGTWYATNSIGINFNDWEYNWIVIKEGSYTIKCKAVDRLGNEEIPGDGIVVTDIEVNPEDLVPTQFSLSQNYPNPFNPETLIEYGLPKNCRVRLTVFNVLGQEIITIIDENQNAGYHQIKWDGRDENGRKVSTGIYLYRLWVSTPAGKADEYVNVKKMILMQ